MVSFCLCCDFLNSLSLGSPPPFLKILLLKMAIFHGFKKKKNLFMIILIIFQDALTEDQVEGKYELGNVTFIN